MNNQDYIVRCDRAGVFFGKIKERSGSEVTMTEVRKLWSWDGACAVEQPVDRGILLRDILETGVAWQEKDHKVTHWRRMPEGPEET